MTTGARSGNLDATGFPTTRWKGLAMFRKLRIVLIAVGFAVLGAAAGRLAADLRRRREQGEPLEITREAAMPRPQEVVPGLVAALRVRDRPWVYLQIPGWFAAFAVNFAFSALGRELRPFARARFGEEAQAAPFWERELRTEARTIDVSPVEDREAAATEDGTAEPAQAPAATPEPAGNGATEGFAPFRS
ncbi:MAG: hypothetical protein O2895_06150 [Chloroflexi bacterium]|nr:hypothetical protein [Chloroflexota bacterium]